MGYFVVLTITWLNSLISKGKGILCTIVAFAWMAYLGGMASPVTTMDFDGYQYYYDLVARGLPGNRLEWLYTFLSKVAINKGLNYAEFRMWLFGITFLILFIAVVKLSEKPVVFAGMFMIFPFFAEVTQVRTFVAYTIVLIGTTMFKGKLNFKRIILFELVIMLAMGFHSSAIVFSLLPIFVFIVQKNGIYKSFINTLIGVTIFLITLLIFKQSAFVGFISKILQLIAGPVISGTFVNLMSHSDGSFLLMFKMVIMYLISLGLIVFPLLKYKLLNLLQESPNFIVTFALSLLGLGLLPLLLVSKDLIRYQRFGVEVIILLISIVYTLLQHRNYLSRSYLALMAFLITITGWESYSVYGHLFQESFQYIIHWVQ